MEGGVDCEGEEGDVDALGAEPDQSHDKILDVFVTEHRQTGRLNLRHSNASLLKSGTVGLVDNDTVGGRGADKRQAVDKVGGASVGVEADERDGVAESTEEEGEMAHEPAELQSLSEGSKALS